MTLDVRALANRLAVEYAGAVPAEEVAALVDRAFSDLERSSLDRRLRLATAEAMCRHALTEGLAHQGVV